MNSNAEVKEYVKIALLNFFTRECKFSVLMHLNLEIFCERGLCASCTYNTFGIKGKILVEEYWI